MTLAPLELQNYKYVHLFVSLRCVQVSPVEVCDPSKVQVFGPAVEGSVPLDELTYFVVDCSEAGPGA